jgi:hypothetical protein
MNRIFLSGVANRCGHTEPETPGRSDEPGALVSKAVDIGAHIQLRFSHQFVGFKKVLFARGVDVEQRNDGNREGNIELDVVSQTNQHGLRKPRAIKDEVNTEVVVTAERMRMIRTLDEMQKGRQPAFWA